MLLRTTIATALLLTGVPAIAAPNADGGTTLARAERNAFTRCMMSQPRIPAGKVVTAPHVDCRKVARDQVASLTPETLLASREASGTEALE